MTSAAAGLVGEALKLLVLLHSLVDGEEAQLEVLHVLLPAIIAAASVDVKENQVYSCYQVRSTSAPRYIRCIDRKVYLACRLLFYFYLIGSGRLGNDHYRHKY